MLWFSQVMGACCSLPAFENPVELVCVNCMMTTEVNMLSSSLLTLVCSSDKHFAPDSQQH